MGWCNIAAVIEVPTSCLVSGGNKLGRWGWNASEVSRRL